MKTFYSQKDKRWRNKKLGFCSQYYFHDSACKLCAVSAFTDKTPLENNEILKKKNGYFSGCNLADQHTANILGIDFNGKMYKQPSSQLYPLIAEVRVGNIQHFIVMVDYGHCADPLDYPIRVKKNKYKIISYRLFKSKNTPMKQYRVTSKLRTAIKDITGKDRKKMDTKELQEKSAKDLHKSTKKWDELEAEYHALVTTYNKLSENYNGSLELINKQRAEIQGYVNAIKRKDTKIDEIIKGNAIQEETIEELEKDIKKLKALNELSAKNTRVVEALQFLYKVITS